MRPYTLLENYTIREETKTSSLYHTSLNYSVLAALQGCHYMVNYPWPYCGSSASTQYHCIVRISTRQCWQHCMVSHFMITISGLSVALQPLVSPSPSRQLALEAGLEVDAYEDSRGSISRQARTKILEVVSRGRHVRGFSR